MSRGKLGVGGEERGSKEVISKGEGAREGRNEESDYFIIKPSLTWAAATARTLPRPSLCGSVCAFVCVHTRCRLCVCFSMRGNFFFFFIVVVVANICPQRMCVYVHEGGMTAVDGTHSHVPVTGLKVYRRLKESSIQNR